MRHIELVHFFCGCGVEIFMDSKTAEKRRVKTGKCMCDECYKRYRRGKRLGQEGYLK